MHLTIEELQAELAVRETKERELRGQLARLWDECARTANARDYYRRRFEELEAKGGK